MTLHITWNYGLFILFLLGIAIGIYLIILLKNLNTSVKVLKEILKVNKDNINGTLKDAPVISKNVVEITETAKNELKIIEGTINTLSETAQMTAAAANTVKNDVVGKIKGILDLVDFVKRIFFKDKESENV